jgi:hypothetical protein
LIDNHKDARLALPVRTEFSEPDGQLNQRASDAFQERRQVGWLASRAMDGKRLGEAVGQVPGGYCPGRMGGSTIQRR